MLKENLVETLVGLFVVVVAALFVIYGYSVSETDSGDGYRVSAQFNRVDGLTIGSDVRMSGIKIGTVRSLELDPASFYANAEFEIANGIDLPDDTSAKITSEGLLGGNYVSLSPGGSEDLLMQAPSNVSNAQLRELHIRLNLPADTKAKEDGSEA